MELLATRVKKEHAVTLEKVCNEICEAEGLACGDISGVCEKFTSKDLLQAGTLRASWMLSKDQYAPIRTINLEHVADLLLGIRDIERVVEATAQLGENGAIHFESGGRLRGSGFIASGRGARSWHALETEISHHWRYVSMRPRTSRVLVAGVNGGRPPATPIPESVIFESAPGSIIDPDRSVPNLFSVQELRENQELAWSFIDHD